MTSAIGIITQSRNFWHLLDMYLKPLCFNNLVFVVQISVLDFADIAKKYAIADSMGQQTVMILMEGHPKKSSLVERTDYIFIVTPKSLVTGDDSPL